MSQLDGRIATIAARQRMLVTLGDVYSVGGNRDHIAARVHGGRWTRLDQGVYLMAGAPLDWGTRELAAVLGAGPGAAASHLAAARIWGIDGFGRAGVEISVPRGRRVRRAGLRVHESTDLDRCHILVRDGIPVTDPERTLLDLGRYVGIPRLSRAVAAARRSDLVDWSSLIKSHAAHARKGRHGTRRLRAVILSDAPMDGVTDSDLEHMVIALLREAGLPSPVIHHRVFDGERFVAEVDLAYPQWKIAIECDGAVHLDAEVRERDLPRQNDLVLLRWTILRFSWSRVKNRPDRVVAEVRASIASRSAP